MKRTLLAAVLTASALAVPGGAWYLSGSRETAREADELRQAPVRQAREAAQRLADRLGARLEALRESESRRPFYHYQNLYHDPKGAYEGNSVIPSPLAEGPEDPLVRTYFQIGADGRLALPSWNEEVEEMNDPKRLTEQQALREMLTPAVQSCQEILRAPRQGVAQSPMDRSVGREQQQELQPSQQRVQQREQQEEKVQTMAPSAWAQNLEPNRVYTDIQKKRQGQLPQVQDQGKGAVAIRVGGFRWGNVTLSEVPTLVALREVGTPAGTLTQGFVVSPLAVSTWLQDTASPARFLPGEPRGEASSALPLEGAAWQVSVDAAAALAEGELRAREVEARFRRQFAGGASTAFLAGLCVVALVWQTERLARQRSQFAASAAHELRTPLAGLRMYGEMLAEGLGEPARAADYARRMASEAERLARVVSNVLGFSRLERGALSIRPQVGDLSVAVKEAVERQKPALEAAGATVSLEIAENLPPASFDADAVAQIVQNLLDNAEKYGRAGQDRGIRLSLKPSGKGFVLLSVADRGPGIPSALRRRLFRPFERGTDPDAPAGLGLGLALVRALARAQGGDVACLDEAGGGTRFEVTFRV